jgi:hypothetical protein
MKIEVVLVILTGLHGDISLKIDGFKGVFPEMIL